MEKYDPKEVRKDDLINELMDMYEHPENSNKEWKDEVIKTAKEHGFGY